MFLYIICLLRQLLALQKPQSSDQGVTQHEVANRPEAPAANYNLPWDFGFIRSTTQESFVASTQYTTQESYIRTQIKLERKL